MYLYIYTVELPGESFVDGTMFIVYRMELLPVDFVCCEVHFMLYGVVDFVLLTDCCPSPVSAFAIVSPDVPKISP